MSTAVVFLGILSILVMIHELGHFLTARYLGIKVE
ncbi:site-2 protease family protein [Candidatus Amesbacteria bacterium]|nr:site-2 protease family protein [Candidatus Amesbacteria bacterium]